MTDNQKKFQNNLQDQMQSVINNVALLEMGEKQMNGNLIKRCEIKVHENMNQTLFVDSKEIGTLFSNIDLANNYSSVMFLHKNQKL